MIRRLNLRCAATGAAFLALHAALLYGTARITVQRAGRPEDDGLWIT